MRTPPLTKAEQMSHYEDLHFALIHAMQEYEQNTGWKITALSFSAIPGETELKVAITTEPPR